MITIETLVEEFKPLVLERFQNEYRQKSQDNFMK